MLPAHVDSIGPRSDDWNFQKSIFWKTIERAGQSALKVALEGIVDGAIALSSLILKELPLFTLHDRTHLDNVLYWMEQFVSAEDIEELGPVGCAVCLVLAYTHDLGMVPEPGTI